MYNWNNMTLRVTWRMKYASAFILAITIVVLKKRKTTREAEMSGCEMERNLMC